MNRRAFAKLLCSTPAMLALAPRRLFGADAGLEREITELLRRELVIDTAACDRFYRYPDEPALRFDPAAILPVVGAGILGIGALTEQLPTFLPEGSKLLSADLTGHKNAFRPALGGAASAVHMLGEFEALFRAVAAHPANSAVARSPDDIVALHRAGKLALVLGLDNGHEIDSKLTVLDEFHRLGLRKLALTHEIMPAWAESDTGDTGAGLRPFGREVIAECNRLGILVDISHSSDQTFWDALKCSRRPLIATHSGARKVTRMARNMTDDMIRALARTGGMLGVGPLLSNQAAVQRKVDSGWYQDTFLVGLWMESKYRDPEELAAAWHSPAKQKEAHRALGLPDVLPGEEITFYDTAGMFEHLDYLIGLVGFDHLGIGTDMVMNWPEYPGVIRGAVGWLLQRRYSEDKIRRVLSGNFLRVFRANAGRG